MAKIIGGTAATSMLVPDWNQTNPNRADYIKNQPDVANALKGSAEGNPIRLDGVSPCKHEIAVGLRSKNLCEDGALNGVTITGNGASNYIHQNLNAHFPDSDTPVTVSMNFTAKDVTYSSNGLLIFCGVIFADGTTSYLGLADTSNYTQGFGSFTVNKKIKRIDISQQARWTGGTITINSIQVEKGTTATAYTPYVDFSKDYMVGGQITDGFVDGNAEDGKIYTVKTYNTSYERLSPDEVEGTLDFTFEEDNAWMGSMWYGENAPAVPVGSKVLLENNNLFFVTLVQKTVQRCGKNLWCFEDMNFVFTTDGKGTQTKLDTGLRIISGQQTTASSFARIYRWLPISALDGKTITLSCNMSASGNNSPLLIIGYVNADGSKRNTVAELKASGSGTVFIDSKSSKAQGCSYIGFWFYSCSGGACEIGDYVDYTNIQVEIGNATEYEPYVEPTTYTADENGNVPVPSLAPTTVLMAGDAVIATAEYNKDINKAFEEIYQAIATMGAAAVAIPEEV